MSWTIHEGDVRAVLPTLPDESVHCVVTSPPYWALRDYGVDGQIGQEQSPDEYVEEREPEPRRLGRRPTLREAMRSARAGIAGDPAGEMLFDAGAPIPPMATGRWGRA